MTLFEVKVTSAERRVTMTSKLMRRIVYTAGINITKVTKAIRPVLSAPAV